MGKRRPPLAFSASPQGVECRSGQSQSAGLDADHLGTLARNAVSDASLALSDGGMGLRVPCKGVTIADPLELDLPALVRVIPALLVLEAGASLTLLETGDAACPRNVGLR